MFVCFYNFFFYLTFLSNLWEISIKKIIKISLKADKMTIIQFFKSCFIQTLIQFKIIKINLKRNMFLIFCLILFCKFPIKMDYQVNQNEHFWYLLLLFLIKVLKPPELFVIFAQCTAMIEIVCYNRQLTIQLLHQLSLFDSNSPK